MILLDFATCVNQTVRGGLNENGPAQRLLDETMDWLVDHAEMLRDGTFGDDEGDRGFEGGDFEDDYGDSGNHDQRDFGDYRQSGPFDRSYPPNNSDRNRFEGHRGPHSADNDVDDAQQYGDGAGYDGEDEGPQNVEQNKPFDDAPPSERTRRASSPVVETDQPDHAHDAQKEGGGSVRDTPSGSGRRLEDCIWGSDISAPPGSDSEARMHQDCKSPMCSFPPLELNAFFFCFFLSLFNGTPERERIDIRRSEAQA